MANAYVYPGGRVDEADYDPAVPVALGTAIEAFEDADDPARFRAHVVALIRECFEEAGVLLATRRDGAPLTSDEADVERLAEHRASLNAGKITFRDVLGQESLVLRGDAVHYFAHWITPPFEARRYDTRFFFAEAPEDQEPVPDYSEMVHGAWFAPADALTAYYSGEIQLPPPTICTLEDLAEVADLDAAIDWSRSQTPCPIEPKLETIADCMHLLLPGDPLYPAQTAVAGPTRIVLRDGHFRREWAPA